MAGLLFVFVDHGAGIRRATYLCLDRAKNVDKNWNVTVSFIIHVNFDHAWAEHYPVTLSTYFLAAACYKRMRLIISFYGSYLWQLEMASLILWIVKSQELCGAQWHKI